MLCHTNETVAAVQEGLETFFLSHMRPRKKYCVQLIGHQRPPAMYFISSFT